MYTSYSLSMWFMCSNHQYCTQPVHAIPFQYLYVVLMTSIRFLNVFYLFKV